MQKWARYIRISYDEQSTYSIDAQLKETEDWACQGVIEKQHQLVKLILERVYVEGDTVVAITLQSNYHAVLGHKTNEPTYLEVDPMVYEWALKDLNL